MKRLAGQTLASPISANKNLPLTFSAKQQLRLQIAIAPRRRSVRFWFAPFKKLAYFKFGDQLHLHWALKCTGSVLLAASNDLAAHNKSRFSADEHRLSVQILTNGIVTSESEFQTPEWRPKPRSIEIARSRFGELLLCVYLFLEKCCSPAFWFRI